VSFHFKIDVTVCVADHPQEQWNGLQNLGYIPSSPPDDPSSEYVYLSGDDEGESGRNGTVTANSCFCVCVSLSLSERATGDGGYFHWKWCPNVCMICMDEAQVSE